MDPILKILPLRPEAVVPERATDGSAGLDLAACISVPLVLAPGQRAMLPTGIAVGLPGPEYVGLVYARSGLAIRHGVALSNGVGVIDSDYTGEIVVGVINLSDQPYTFEPGERIAQLVVTPVAVLPIKQVVSLDKTVRGSAGFGSTGR